MNIDFWMKAMQNTPLQSGFTVGQNIEAAVLIVDKISDQITGGKGGLKNLPGVKTPGSRQR